MDGWDAAWAWGGVGLYRSRAWEKNVYLVSLLWREKCPVSGAKGEHGRKGRQRPGKEER